jgi:hypothetical protein
VESHRQVSASPQQRSGEYTTVGESRPEPQRTKGDAYCHEIGPRLWEATARRAGKPVRQNDTADPDSYERDVLVKGVSSACMSVADDENPPEQQDAYSRERERAELPTERKRGGDTEYRREKEDSLDD